VTARAVIDFALYLFLRPTLLFISAGTWNWPPAWVYVILGLLATVGSRLIVLKKNPDTLRERARFATSEGTPAWDRILVPVVGLLGPLMMMVIAGLDHRFRWSPIVPRWGQYLATVAVAGGFGLGVWAMVVNRYSSAVARIQRDRAQVVVKEGPYRYARHPSYAGAVLAYLALPIMLDAIWALIPASGMIAAVVMRTGLEDQMLLEELDGYQRYAEETRYRLIPGLW
jgi:protein-S-isoprenylcysteine O-methyltransferase Ste14